MKLVLSFILMTLLSVAAIAVPAPKPITFKVDPSSSKVEWVAYKLTGQHSGTVNIKSGALEFNGEKLIAGKLEIDMTALAVTDIQGEWGTKLLNHLKSDDFFSIDKFASSNLTIKTSESKGAGKYNVVADLTIKGITKEITFDAFINQAAGTAMADLKVDRTWYDIKYRSGKFFPEIGDKMIKDEFDLKVSLSFGKGL
ncbi:MAG: YceI family protein [Saprospiraceae bacterium]|nr:YceI family protein [Saprospiraceae bacterium]